MSVPPALSRSPAPTPLRSILRLLLAAALLVSNACLEVPEKSSLATFEGADAASPIGAGRSEDQDAGSDATGRIELVGTAWLPVTSIVVRFIEIARTGEPFITVTSDASPSPLASFAIPFADRESTTTGTHAFDPLPVGSYRIRLMRDVDQVVQETSFSVIADSDGDSTPDDADGCPLDPAKTSLGLCGCGAVEVDTDLDGSPDCVDGCPGHPLKVAPGTCGCEMPDEDLDDDGSADCDDECPLDALKVEAGSCGCGIADIDTDDDGTPDCTDACPGDGTKIAVGACGCGVADTDQDGDGSADCRDLCPLDAAKVGPGQCGCGVVEGTCAGECASDLPMGAQLVVGEQRCSANGEVTFGLDADGFLHLRYGSEVVWSAFQSGAAAIVKMQNDGNLVARSASGAAVWSSGTAGKNGATLAVEDDGSVVLRLSGVVVWSVGPFRSGELFCREARENQEIRLACPAGETITAIEFASYGKPTGQCGDSTVDTACNFAAQSFVQNACVGENACAFVVDKAKFTIPCAGPKRLAVEYLCGSDDLCPDDPLKAAPGACGCGLADTDFDGDGVADCNDACPDDANKTVTGACGCHVAETDSDSDGLANCVDGCPNDALKSAAGACGCGIADTDFDGDGTADCHDQCPLDSAKTVPGQCGCGVAEGSCGSVCSDELRANIALAPGEQRCSKNGRFSFGLNADGYLTLREGSEVVWSAFQTRAAVTMKLQGDGNLVARDAANAAVWSSSSAGNSGAILTVRDDGSVTLRVLETVVWSIGPFQSGDALCREARENQQIHLACPTGLTISAVEFASYGKPTGSCGSFAVDGSCHFAAQSVVETACLGKSTCDLLVDKAIFTTPCSGTKRLVVQYACGVDECPEDAAKITPGACGCGVPDTDNDSDGAANCVDVCPDDAGKTAEGACGCHVAETDTDGDGTPDCVDACPDDANKIAEGTCGCHVAETNADGDAAMDCVDACPNDASKTAAGACGCGVSDTDGDGDGAPDCVDACPSDANKTTVGACGCGVADTDGDGDGALDCVDACPSDPNKTAPGQCGCGVAEGSCPPPCSNQLLPNAQMTLGEDRCSSNGTFRFGLGSDGYLRLREGNEVVWSAFQSAAAATMKLQGDGNLVARDASSAAVWSSGTAGKNGAVLTVEDDGSVVLRQTGLVVWSIGPFRSGDTLCREARENQQIHLSCPAGQTISGFEFASYGKPTGTCGSYAIDAACHYSALPYLNASCAGQSTCDFVVDKTKFTIPCTGQKRLVVAFTCGAP